ncbi:MAG: ferritin [Candidatus Zixiibacteriota bacterium]
MISKKIEKAFNEQINAEMFSFYLYLSMSAWLDEKGFAGMSKWMRIQADEEMIHAMKFYDHILERNGSVKLTAIEGPKGAWKAPLDIFKAGLEHEQMITGRINNLVKLAHQENDYASHSFLQWFVDEQVEEESNAQNIIDQLTMVSGNPAALFLVDRELGARPPAAAAEAAAQ